MAFFGLIKDKPKPAPVPKMPRWKHIQKIDELVRTDLNPKTQSEILGHIERLIELIQNLDGMTDRDRIFNLQSLQVLQDLVIENVPNTRNMMVKCTSNLLVNVKRTLDLDKVAA